MLSGGLCRLGTVATPDARCELAHRLAGQGLARPGSNLQPGNALYRKSRKRCAAAWRNCQFCGACAGKGAGGAVVA